MILPSKHLSQDRALLTVGARILRNLDNPSTISALWEVLLRQGEAVEHSTPSLSYDQFVLALDFLFLVDAIELIDGLLKRKAS